MSSTPKRPRLGLHLLTAILTMFAAGLAVWINIEVAVFHPTVWYAGLPLMDYPGEAAPSGIALHSPFTLPINIALNLGFLFVIAYVCESILRRREGRKP